MWIVAVRKALPQEHLIWQAASLCTPWSGDYTVSRLCKLLHWLFLKQCTMWGWNQSVYLIFPKPIFSWPLVWIVVVRKTSPGEYLLWEAASLCTPRSGDQSVSIINSLVASLVGVCKDQDHVSWNNVMRCWREWKCSHSVSLMLCVMRGWIPNPKWKFDIFFR